MIPSQCKSNEQVRYPGIEVMTADGTRRAKLDLQDRQPSVTTNSGDAVGVVENLVVVTDELGTGHKLDVVIKGGTEDTASELEFTADKDKDAGEDSNIGEIFNHTTVSEEAGSLKFPAGVTEPKS